MSAVLAIDPGNIKSAFVLLDKRGRILQKGILPNFEMLKKIKAVRGLRDSDKDHMAIEMIASMGMAVGKEVFETAYWIGRFVQAWCPSKYTRIYRLEVKLHLCGLARAKDKNIRQALLDKVGLQGTKNSPGPTYGISKDMWSALAVGITYLETKKGKPSAD